MKLNFYTKAQRLKGRFCELLFVPLCLCVNLFFCTSVWASDRSEMRQAAIYYEAGEYGEAQELYEGLLQSNLDPWEQNAVTYNLGTTLLAEGNLEQSISTLNSVKDTNPLILERLKANLAIAQYRLAQQSTDEKLRSYHLFDALKNLDIAENARCQLQKLKSSDSCEPSKSQMRLRTAIKQALVLIEQSSEPSLADLVFRVQVALHNIEFLEKTPSDLRGEYQELFYDQWQGWNAYFSDAEYIEAANLMRKGEFSQSQRMLQKLEEDLTQRLQKEWENLSRSERLQKLTSIYENILKQTPLQPLRVRGLLHQVQYLKDEDIANKLRVISQAITALDQYQIEEAQIYLEVGLQVLKRANQNQEKLPKVILQNAIEEQKHGISLNRHRLNALSLKPEIIDLISNEQKQVLAVAQLFPPAAIEEQKKQFKAEGPQRQPWDEVLPAFDKGYEAARLASEWIPAYPEQSLDKQHEALKWWQQALTQIDAPREKEKAPSETMEEKLSIQKVKELLQEMEFDDEIPKKNESMKRIPKPW